MNSLQKEIQKALEKSINYSTFLTQFEHFASVGKSSGHIVTEDTIHFTKLNFSRVKRLNKTLEFKKSLFPILEPTTEKLTLLVITETWCGDAAQTIPVIHKIAEHHKNMELKIVYRDQNLTLMNYFLTHGGQAIPIVILLDEDQKVINHWGPRPSIATKMVQEFKQQHGTLTPEFKKDLQIWYNKDKGKNTLADLSEMITTWNKKTLKKPA